VFSPSRYQAIHYSDTNPAISAACSAIPVIFHNTDMGPFLLNHMLPEAGDFFAPAQMICSESALRTPAKSC
jgi:hypothetical protein